LAVVISGWKGLALYPALLRFTDRFPDVNNVTDNVSLRGLMSLGLEDPGPLVALVAIMSIVVIIVAALVSRRFDLSSAFCVALIASMLTAFHAHTEELTLLLIPFALLQSRVRSRTLITVITLIVLLSGFVALTAGPRVLFALMCYSIVLFGLWKTRQPALGSEGECTASATGAALNAIERSGQ